MGNNVEMLLVMVTAMVVAMAMAMVRRQLDLPEVLTVSLDLVLAGDELLLQTSFIAFAYCTPTLIRHHRHHHHTITSFETFGSASDMFLMPKVIADIFVRPISSCDCLALKYKNVFPRHPPCHLSVIPE